MASAIRFPPFPSLRLCHGTVSCVCPLLPCTVLHMLSSDHSQGLPIGWVAIMLALLASMGGFIFGVSRVASHTIPLTATLV